MKVPTKQKIVFFQKKLLDYFKKSGREHLPWRKKGMAAYEVWVSEVMLQQTQVPRVIVYYERFLKRFPTVESLAKAKWEAFLPYYAGLGYYSRGKNMLRTAEAVVQKYQGKFPTTLPELEGLPGIGPYTARAVASFATGAPHLAWDTNLKRVFGRFFRGGKQLLTREDEVFFDAQLGKRAQELNAAVMDFGSSICVARPKCEACMLKRSCRYYREKGRQELKAMRQREKRPRSGTSQTTRALVYLHENHKKYYSAKKSRFEPFLLPSGYTDRAGIKAYFKERFALELSVRPPHTEARFGKGTVLLVNAQILLGKASFATFPKSTVLEYNEDVFSS